MLAVINIDNIVIANSSIRIKISELIKPPKRSNFKPELSFAKFYNKPIKIPDDVFIQSILRK